MTAYSVTVSRHVDGKLVGSATQCTKDGATNEDARQLALTIQGDMTMNDPDCKSYEFTTEIKVLP